MKMVWWWWWYYDDVNDMMMMMLMVWWWWCDDDHDDTMMIDDGIMMIVVMMMMTGDNEVTGGDDFICWLFYSGSLFLLYDRLFFETDSSGCSRLKVPLLGVVFCFSTVWNWSCCNNTVQTKPYETENVHKCCFCRVFTKVIQGIPVETYM